MYIVQEIDFSRPRCFFFKSWHGINIPFPDLKYISFTMHKIVVASYQALIFLRFLVANCSHRRDFISNCVTDDKQVLPNIDSATIKGKRLNENKDVCGRGYVLS